MKFKNEWQETASMLFLIQSPKIMTSIKSIRAFLKLRVSIRLEIFLLIFTLESQDLLCILVHIRGSIEVEGLRPLTGSQNRAW